MMLHGIYIYNLNIFLYNLPYLNWGEIMDEGIDNGEKWSHGKIPNILIICKVGSPAAQLIHLEKASSIPTPHER